jgi:hypothetical protein
VLSVYIFIAHYENTYLVLGARRLHERLVCTATTSDDSDHTTAGAGEDLLGTRWELDTGLALIRVVANDSNVVTGSTAERTTVTVLVLDVGEDGTLRDGVEGQDVADGESGVLSGVDELLQCQSQVSRVCVILSKLTWPVYMPSLAMKVSVLCLNLYGWSFRKQCV